MPNPSEVASTDKGLDLRALIAAHPPDGVRIGSKRVGTFLFAFHFIVSWQTIQRRSQEHDKSSFPELARQSSRVHVD